MNEEIKKYIDKCVLCWLATASSDGFPNVSPKEIFTHFEESIIIANIASPQSVKNILENPKVCVSFIDIFEQKGFQVKGLAEIIDRETPLFDRLKAPLLDMTKGKFPFASIIKIDPKSALPILAPSYLFFPNTTIENQIESAKKTYFSRLEP